MNKNELIEEFLRRTDVTYLNLRPHVNTLDDISNVELAAFSAYSSGFSHFCTWPHLLDSMVTKLPNMAVVTSFPVGIASVDSKLNDIARIAQLSPQVNEFDIVLNLSTSIESIILELGELMHELKEYDIDRYVFKFIVETPIWGHGELVKLGRAISLSKINEYRNMMIKTCTGTQGVVEEEHLKYFTGIKLKASGGIRTVDQVRLLIEEYNVARLGIGYNSAFKILKELKSCNEKPCHNTWNTH